MRARRDEIVRELLADDIREVKLLQEHIHDGSASSSTTAPGGGR